MDLKLFDSELKVMDTLWKAGGDLPAGQIAKILSEEIGWNRNTTYTVFKRFCLRCSGAQGSKVSVSCADNEKTGTEL